MLKLPHPELTRASDPAHIMLTMGSSIPLKALTADEFPFAFDRSTTSNLSSSVPQSQTTFMHFRARISSQHPTSSSSHASSRPKTRPRLIPSVGNFAHVVLPSRRPSHLSAVDRLPVSHQAGSEVSQSVFCLFSYCKGRVAISQRKLRRLA